MSLASYASETKYYFFVFLNDLFWYPVKTTAFKLLALKVTMYMCHLIVGVLGKSHVHVDSDFMY